MANKEHLELLKDVAVLNQWRKKPGNADFSSISIKQT